VVDFGIQRSKDNIPNLPNITHVTDPANRAIERPHIQLRSTGKAAPAKTAGLSEEAAAPKILGLMDGKNGAKDVIASALKDIEKNKPAKESAFQGTLEEIKKTADEMNKMAESVKSNIRFDYNKDLNQIVVQVLDKDNKIERTIPPQCLIELKESLREQIGQILDREI
jgi:uncharacterized FlaG/YvyC family protein